MTLISPEVPIFRIDEILGHRIERDLYVIVDGRIVPTPAAVAPRVHQIGAAAINSLLYAGTVSDLYKIFAITERDGINAHFAWTPETFVEEPKEAFDTAYMRKLYDHGRELTANGTLWNDYPPYFAPKPEKAGRSAAPAELAETSPREAAAAPQKQAALPGASDLPAAEAKPSTKATAAPTSILPKSMGGEAELPEVTAPAAKAKAASDKPVAKDEADFSAGQAPESKKAAPVAEAARGRFSVRSEPVPSFVASRAQGPKAQAFEPVVLTFAWYRPAAAAAFRRGENLWLVFDQPAPRDVVRQIATVAPHLGEAQLIENDGATILIVAAVPTVAPRLSRNGQTWWLGPAGKRNN